MSDKDITQFASIGTIMLWSASEIRYLGNDDRSPYTYKDGMYHYFSLQDGKYTLFCTTERDLNQKEMR